MEKGNYKLQIDRKIPVNSALTPFKIGQPILVLRTDKIYTAYEYCLSVKTFRSQEIVIVDE